MIIAQVVLEVSNCLSCCPSAISIDKLNWSSVIVLFSQQWRLLPYVAATYVYNHYFRTSFKDSFEFQMKLIFGEKGEHMVSQNSALGSPKASRNFAAKSQPTHQSVPTSHTHHGSEPWGSRNKTYCENSPVFITRSIRCCICSLARMMWWQSAHRGCGTRVWVPLLIAFYRHSAISE